MKLQVVAIEVEVPDRLHDPADMGWQEMLKRMLEPIDSYAARDAKVRVLAGRAPVRQTDREETGGHDEG